ncbi:heparinase II/III family protein [Wenxinia marina]|uniref:Heparinase II/III-like C-terminal domain-containing protein n=1 Tax=Wenxinia marina DSM 24838 TaxID=1123501 RepID=A0A0D0QID7_9RHOB|nr:heparinase II/III family protein [Wenxinia marina]KIQ70813.1 hypothetical protein Wenmar_00187 [Wenxinia marina DSM 24838]GGL57078.1 hypothetical protein GCM10011392_09460 [Wenxinia marina]
MRDRWTGRLARLLDRVEARRSARRGTAAAFHTMPEPRTVGHFARGRQIVAGNLLIGGELLQLGAEAPWDAVSGRPAEAELHGFGWLDDLAAVGDSRARARAQDWQGAWLDRYGGGQGPGWTPGLTGRRLIRWITHAIFLLQGREADAQQRVFRSLGGQTLFLSRRWRSAPPGLPRFEALTGLIYAALALEGQEDLAAPAILALSRECIHQVDGDGGIASRNPEDLLEVLTLLTWAAEALDEAGRPVPEAIAAAITRIAPTLRALRHADGGLARFHGGGRGIDGRLEQALSAAGVRGRRTGGLAMGFARMQGGRTTLIADAAPPPRGAVSAEAHASTLAFELTSARRPVVVNCGSGRSFGPDWRRAGRATPSHSTLCIDGVSSARLADDGETGADLIADGPQAVQAEWTALADGTRLELSHDGWRRSHGLVHARTLDLGFDGRGLVGEEVLTTLTKADETVFDRVMEAEKLAGLRWTVRFHLHPEVEAGLDLGGHAVSLALRSGEIWVFRQDGAARMTLEKSVYLESGRLRPRATQQVVLSGRAMSYATRVRWSLSKAHETPDAVRDYAPAAGSDAD